MNTQQEDLIRQLRLRLNQRAWLFEDHRAYQDGVEDALDEVVSLLDEMATPAGR